jgi:hypothetical protein
MGRWWLGSIACGGDGKAAGMRWEKNSISAYSMVVLIVFDFGFIIGYSEFIEFEGLLKNCHEMRVLRRGATQPSWITVRWDPNAK